jgi:hypothetical protein
MVMTGKMVKSSFRTARRSSCSSCSDDDGGSTVVIADSEGECLDDKVESAIGVTVEADLGTTNTDRSDR